MLTTSTAIEVHRTVDRDGYVGLGGTKAGQAAEGGQGARNYQRPTVSIDPVPLASTSASDLPLVDLTVGSTRGRVSEVVMQICQSRLSAVCVLAERNR
jgi:hypothetical protein